MKVKTIRRAGFTLVEIMIVVAIIGLLAAIAVPNFVKARTTAQMNGCINNLRQIDGAVQQWALEKRQGEAAPVSWTDISEYLKNSVLCPAATSDQFADSYLLNTVADLPTCKIKPDGPNAHKLIVSH